MRMKYASTTTSATRAPATRNEGDLGTGVTVRASEAVKSAREVLKGTRGSHD